MEDVLSLGTAIRSLPIGAYGTWFLAICVLFGQMILQFLSSFHVFGGLCADHFLGLCVLLPYGRR